MLLPNQVLSFAMLRKMDYSDNQIKMMLVSFVIFPTPFKGIYYVPFQNEKKSKTIQEPLKALTASIRLYLKTDDFYYTGRTAEEWYGVKWHPSGLVHIVNPVLSKRIDLEKRVAVKQKKKTYYSRHIASILLQYGRSILFHRYKTFSEAKFTRTPAGNFATKRQLRKDKKRFRC